MKFSLFAVALLLTTPALAQENSLTAHQLLTRIGQLQSRGNKFYAPGLFPTVRYHKNDKPEQDNTIFYTALVAYTLQQLRASMTDSLSVKSDSIVEKCRSNYDRYRNRHQDFTYNFWQTHPDLPFPNDSKRSGKEKYRMPDDFDDTSIIYLTLPRNDSANRMLKEKMIRHTNLWQKRVHGTFRRYRKFKAYNTWFGDRMPLDFDICVMSNTLAYALSTGLPLNANDSATVLLIEQTIRNDDHLKYPVIVSPYYQKPSVILYHVSRLAALPKSPLVSLREKLVSDLQTLYKTPLNPMEQLLVVTSLYRLSVSVDYRADEVTLAKGMNTFIYFAATPFGSKPLWIRRMVGKSTHWNFNYSCEGYYWALVLENILLHPNSKKSQVD